MDPMREAVIFLLERTPLGSASQEDATKHAELLAHLRPAADAAPEESAPAGDAV